MELPVDFSQEIKACLGPEYAEFAAAMGDAPHRGLRFHTGKISGEEGKKALAIPLGKVDWAPAGYRYGGDFRPAYHPFYHGGLYYIQEPSAMLPAEILCPRPGERVLDLCAAPGGKGTRLGELLAEEGLLVLNDSSHSRCQALVRNVELFGLKNAVILNEKPERIAGKFPGYFDKVLVDAPCSGQGMFRKDSQVLKTGADHRPFARWQREILAQAALLTAPGGEIVYSTCTFRREENEDIVQWFLADNRDFSLIPIPKLPGFCGGLGGMEEVVRLWPHRVKGEGHFAAHFKKEGTRKAPTLPFAAQGLGSPLFRAFEESAGLLPLVGSFYDFSGHLYFFPSSLPDLHGLKVVRAGLYLGEAKGSRFAPAHSLALAQGRRDGALSFPLDSREVDMYLKGFTLESEAAKGYHLFLADAYPLGWVKSDGRGALKNHYPKAWRNL